MLGKKQFSLGKPLTSVAAGEEIYTISHTKEQFRSKEDYEKRVDLYKQSIWTCRCTGHTTLTHEEAWKSEQTALKTLKGQFQQCFEKPVLQIVHHSTDSLDTLNDLAWTKLHQYLIEGEQVTFNVNNGSKVLKGVVVGISPSTEEVSVVASNKCNSPSSDKENADKNSPKKWTPPKLLPNKYSVRLDDGPVINSVPVEDLIRCEKPPSKDLVRLFIRAHAVRTGSTNSSPWVVDDHLVKRHALPSKFADFLLSPSKMAEAAKRAEEVGKKRKRQNQDGGATKKQKLNESGEKKTKPKNKNKLTPVLLNKKVKTSGKDSEKKFKKKDGKDGMLKKKSAMPGKKSVTPVKKSVTPVKKSVMPVKKKKDVIEIRDSSDEEVTLAVIKKMKASGDDSGSDVPLANLTDQGTPKKKTLNSASSTPKKKKRDSNTSKESEKIFSGTPKSKKSGDQKTPTKRKRRDSEDSDIPLSKLSPKKATGTPKKSQNKMQKSNESTPKKKVKKVGDKSEEKKGPNKLQKGEDKSSGKAKKGMKQMTLLDLANKKEAKDPKLCTPKKSPGRPARPQTPLIVKKLLALNKDEDRQKFSMLLKKACMVLTPTQKKNLPSPLKEKVQRRIELIEERKALGKMSESEREAYMKEKKDKQKSLMKEKLKEKLKEMRQRYEDQDLKLQPLPAPKLIPTPENVPNELFGDITMVTEFITSYSGLLMPDSEYPIYTDALMKALAGGSQGFAYLSRVLSVLLQTLLQDEIAEGYSELKVPLRDIAVNPYTVSELVRLCLRKDDHSSGDAGSDAGCDELEVAESVIQQLESQEFFHLEVSDKLAILRGLCLRVMATYSVQDYMEEKQREAIQLTKQRNSEMKGFNEKLKEKKLKTEEKPSASSSVNGDAFTPTPNGPAITLTSFYGKKLDESPATNSPVDSQGECEGDNLISIIKRRRMMAAKAAQEKEKRELVKRLQKEKEYEEERQKRQREQFEAKFKDSIYLARTLLRHTPIGYDRHHNRYWMFTHTTPGLYIEKGWMGLEISHNPGNIPDDREPNEEETASQPFAISSSTPESPSKRLKLTHTKKKALVESTVPCCGQNLWFTYNSLKDLDSLLHTLHPQGIREAALKTEIKKRYQDITRAIQGYQRNNLELRDSEGNEEMVAGFKKELSDVETRLRNGGLGGVANYAQWEAQLMSTTDIATMGQCLLEVQEAIMDKFLQKFMRLPKKEELEEVKKEEDDGEKDGDKDDESAVDKKLTVAEKRLQQWKDSVLNCPTMSRLHVLLSMMDSCIKWEKSAENAKCKICRKKGDDDRLLLCDDCNHAFHMYCLRPQLIHVPKGDWFCAGCAPHTKRRNFTVSHFESEEEDSCEEEEVQHTNCEECGGEAGEEDGEQLVSCHKCPCVYHLDCHQPPLRRVPRGVWECNDCKNGIRRRNKKRLQRKAASTKKSYKVESSIDDDEDEESEQSSAEEDDETESNSDEEKPPKPSARSSRNSSGARNSTVSRRASKPSHQSSRNSGDGTTKGSSRTSRGSAGNSSFEDYGSVPRSRRAPSDLSLCEDILHHLMKHPSSWPFLEPVGKKEVPDYHQIIKKPMDFQTMLKKCARLSYSSPQEFVDDAILVFSNAATYNQPDSDVYSCMKEVEKFFSELLAKHLPDYASTQHFVADREECSARSRRARKN